MDPTIGLHIHGGTPPLVAGFLSLAVLEVRHVHLDRGPGRMVTGPYYRAPRVGERTWYVLHESRGAKVLVLKGRTFQPDLGVYAPMLPAAGHHDAIVLRAPPRLPPRTLDRLERLVRIARWHEAASYRSTYPHEYSQRASWPDDTSFVWFVEQIKIYGHLERFNGGLWTGLDVSGFHLWGGYEAAHRHRWINRRPTATPVPIVNVSPQIVDVTDGVVLRDLTTEAALVAWLVR